LINPTKIQKENGNNLIFKLQKAGVLQVLKVECKKNNLKQDCHGCHWN
jgi:hypothetical protein